MSNPHFALAQDQLDPEHKWNWTSHDLANISEIIEGNAQATLALAYEQKTANIIAFNTHLRELGANGGLDSEIIDRLGYTRLGLGDTK